MIVFAADHRGYALKEELKSFVLERYDSGAVQDAGALTEDPTDDYPDFAFLGAHTVAENPEENRGIMVCGSGMGMVVVANKIKGVRATVAYSRDSVIHARRRDNVNTITLAADILTSEEAKEIVLAFLATEFAGEERDLRRLEKIRHIESENFR